jgi:SNF2 family DNA or RNA helicase
MTLTDWKHQAECLDWLDTRTFAMLGMDMGTGKTRVAIRYADTHDAKLMLVLCPKVVLDVWPDQFSEHSDRQWYVYGVDPKHSVAKRKDKCSQALVLAQAMNRPCALLVNYDAAWREPFGAWLQSLPIDVGVWDEVHKIKAPGGKASRFVSSLKKVTKRRLGMSGTFMVNGPLDVYAEFRALNTEVFGTSFLRFKSQYAIEKKIDLANGGSFMKVVDYQNMDDFNRRLGEHTYIVKKRDVLDLPPVTHEAIPIELSPSNMKQYKQFKDELVLEVDRGLMTANNALTKLLRLQQMTSGYMKTDRWYEDGAVTDSELVQIGTDKADAFSDHLDSFPTDEPIVVFARFHCDLDNIRRIAEGQHRHYIELSGRANGYEVWKRGTGTVLGVQIQSGGTGVDFTRSAYAIYYSVGFSNGDYEQSLSRLDRPGQVRPVTIYHLVASDTIDVKVYRSLRAKRNVIDTVVNSL